MEDYRIWTSCELYGHVFIDGHCFDCGERKIGEEDEESS